jgi:hypothetical protein
MTRAEGLKAAIEKFESTRDREKPYPTPDHYAIAAFWEGRRKAKELFYLKNRGIKKF